MDALNRTHKHYENPPCYRINYIYKSSENLYKECGWTALSERRQQHKLSFVYNLNTDMVSSYIQDLIYSLVIEISDYPLRNNRNISVPLSRTFILQNGCIPSSIRLWNSLEDDLNTYQHYKPFRDICGYFQCAPFPRLETGKIVWVLSFDH